MRTYPYGTKFGVDGPDGKALWGPEAEKVWKERCEKCLNHEFEHESKCHKECPKGFKGEKGKCVKAPEGCTSA